MAVSDFTHHLETLLDKVRNGQRNVTTTIRAVCLEAVDVLREMLSAVKSSADIDDVRVQEVSARLQVLLSPQTALTTTDTKKEEDATAQRSQPATAGWRITFIPNLDMLQAGNDPVRLLQELSELGDIKVVVNDDRLPAFTDLVPEECYLHWDIELAGDVDKVAISEIFEWVEDDCELSIEPLQVQVKETDGNQTTCDESPESYDASASRVVAGQQQGHTTSSQALTVLAGNESGSLSKVNKRAAADPAMSSIRVGTEKVDSLINLVGELVITQSMLSQMGENFEPELLPKLLDGLEQLERNTRELQEGIMRIRMIPISFVFNRLPRLVHDLSSKLGKKIELKLSGEQTELDKTVMEKIGDPLVHLVRNSLDHGLEKPEKRLEAGKAETGLLHLQAYHQGGNIVIEIVDDGAGLNEDKILNKAIERGMVSDTDVLSPERIHELIFMPGFSTADVVNDISGRGVGMDVVKKNIQSLNGTIEVKSEPGKGSKFTIRLPLTLAIMDGQIVQISQQKYIIPLISIIESVVIKANTVKKVAGKGELYKFRDEYIPLIRLHEVFDQKQKTEGLEGELLVVVESEHSKAGLLVDDLLAQQQIVIKSLETHYRNVRGVSGATILGDGMVALILDVTGLMTMYRSPVTVDEKSRSWVA